MATKTAQGRRWAVKSRNGYHPIDEFRGDGTGTVGDPLIIFAAEYMAEQLATDLNEVYQRHGSDAASDLLGHLKVIFKSQRAQTQREAYRAYMATRSTTLESFTPAEPDAAVAAADTLSPAALVEAAKEAQALNDTPDYGVCRYAVACTNKATLLLQIGQSDYTYPSCQECADLKDRFGKRS